MGRPPLALGTYGKITVYEVMPKKYRARCRFRDFDGRIYPVERYGETRTKAENRLKEAIRDWVAPLTASGVTAKSRLREVAAVWMQEFERDADQQHRSWGSVDTYRNRLEKVILPAMGELQMYEVSTPICDALCRRVRDQSSASSAKTVRSILSGICGLAVRHGALDSNPVREVARLESRKAKNKPTRSRSLTADEVLDLLGKLDADEEAARFDLPDLVRFFLGTGERTGEALNAGWSDFDEHQMLISMSGNVIRAKGRGKIVNTGKTENSERDIALPTWCVALLAERRASVADPVGLIFPSSTGTAREASNVRNRAWRPFLRRAGYEWVTFRTLRKTVATLLDDAGLTARQIADVLGHSRPSMTQDVYMGRRNPSRAGADVLDGAIQPGELNAG